MAWNEVLALLLIASGWMAVSDLIRSSLSDEQPAPFGDRRRLPAGITSVNRPVDSMPEPPDRPDGVNPRPFRTGRAR